jgi:radical SAM superfamily enzyme YgiQ (UPF0313 family)
MKEKTILLVEPPFYRLYDHKASLNRVPHALGYLAGSIKVKKPDWKVWLYNSDFSPHDASLSYKYLYGAGFEIYRQTLKNPQSLIWEEIKKKIVEYRPSVIGISVKSQNLASALMVARIAKSVDENMVVVFGGPHPSLVKSEILDDPVVDIGVLREGEETLIDILDSIEGKLSLSTVKGIVYKEKNKIIKNPPREFISDLDSAPFPVQVARDSLIDYEQYPLEAFKHVFAARGCPYECSFCGSRYIWSRKVRFRSVGNIVAEILEISKLGIRDIHFDDDTFGIKKSFILKLCQEIKKKCPGLKWSCEIHIKLVDDETIAEMKSAGCQEILLGIESGNDRILTLIKKNITVNEAISAARLIKKHKIYLHTFFMVGFPQETEETMNDTMSAMTSIPSDNLICSIFTPYKGTELFDYCKKQNIIPQHFDVSLYNHQSPENYFCPNIPIDVYKDRLNRLEKKVNRIRNRQKLKMIFSDQGFQKLRQAGFKRSLSKLIRFCRNLI